MKGLLLSEEFNLIVQNGTLQIGEIKEQCAQLIVNSEKGEIKEYPVLGVGLRKYIKSVGREKEIIRETKLQLALDNMDSKVTIENKVMNIEIL